VREPRERGDVHIQHRLYLLPLGALKEAVVAEAGVIDEQIRWAAHQRAFGPRTNFGVGTHVDHREVVRFERGKCQRI